MNLLQDRPGFSSSPTLDHVKPLPASYSVDIPPWKAMALRKRAAQLASIPPEWRLPAMDALPQNTLEYLRTSGVLTREELAITEITDATVLLREIASGKLTALEVTRAYSKRAAIAQQLIGCCTEMFFDEALKRAEALDKHVADTGRVIGPLHGLPISLKDLFNVKGHDTTWGWVGLIDQPAKENSILADVLISQGAILYVKTNIAQFLMMSDSYNHVFKQSLHPINRQLMSGGSSGGEGALVGCLGSPAGFGSDTGGSIRIPASLQGIYGLSPSPGRVAFDDSGKRVYIAPPVTGPMAPSLSTIEKVMQAYLEARPWELDPVVVPSPWRSELAEKPGRSLRLAYYLDDGFVRPQPPLQRAVADVVRKLRAAGHELIEWAADSHTEMIQHWNRAIKADGGDSAREHCDLSGEPLIDGLIVGDEADRLTVREAEELSETRTQNQRTYLKRWREAKLDGIIAPVRTFVGLPPRQWVRSNPYVGYTAVWNWLGFAALAMPVSSVGDENAYGDETWKQHVVRNDGDRWNWENYDPHSVKGIPVGLQIVGGLFGEERTVAIAKVIEEALQSQQELGNGVV